MLRGTTSFHVQGLKVHTRSTNVETKTQQPMNISELVITKSE
jgi:hypothetical protein